VTVPTGALPAGRYLVTLTTPAGRSARPLVILR
jgi:hypothetical protein